MYQLIPALRYSLASDSKMGIQPDVNRLFGRPVHTAHYTTRIGKRQSSYQRSSRSARDADRWQ